MAKKQQEKNNKKGKKPGKLSIILLIIMMLVAAGFLVMITLVDAFPRDMLMVMIGLMAALLLIAALLLFRRRRWLRVIGILLTAVFVAVYGLGIYYMQSTYAMFAKISADEEAVAPASEGLDVTQDSFNLYITGIDQWNEEKGYDLERSDVNMILTVCPGTHRILLTSIPRDSYVPLHRTGTMDKLTHTGIYGVDETLNTIEDWTGIHMDYYVKANFDGCVDLVDAIGGIDIYNPVEFKSALNGHLYEQGNIHLQGRGALYYARERKAFEGEDQLRVKNQLVVVKAILDKVLTSTTLLTSYSDIMSVLGDEVETNMSIADMQALVRMQLGDMREWDIETQRMTGEYEMEIVASMDPSNKYLVLKVDPDSFSECIGNIHRTMEPTEEELQAAEEEKQKYTFMKFLNNLLKRGDDTEEDPDGSGQQG